MRAAVSRSLVAAAYAAALAATGVSAAAPAAPPLPAPCGARVVAHFTDTATDGNVHRMTVVLSSTGNTACTLRGFPALVLPSAQGAPLPLGHITLARDVVLAPGSTASFGMRYTTSQAPATAPCSLGVVVNGFAAAVDGTIPLAACASITQIDVTSFANGAQPLPVASVPASSAGSAAVCAVADLILREVRTVPAGELAPSAIYALQNRSAAPCLIAGAIGIRLLDASGSVSPLRISLPTMMTRIVTLPPGYEASFGVAYFPHAPKSCPASASIVVYVAAQTETEPIAAPATIMWCTQSELRVGNLRLGIPLLTGLAPG